MSDQESQQIEQRIREMQVYYEESAIIARCRKYRDARRSDLHSQRENAQRVLEGCRQALVVAEEAFAAIDGTINSESHQTESEDEREITKMAADEKRSRLELEARWAELHMTHNFGTPPRNSLMRSSVSKPATPRHAASAISSVPPEASPNNLSASCFQNTPAPNTNVVSHQTYVSSQGEIDTQVKAKQFIPTVSNNVASLASRKSPFADLDGTPWSDGSDEEPLLPKRRRVHGNTNGGQEIGVRNHTPDCSDQAFYPPPRNLQRLSDMPLTLDINSLDGLDSVAEYRGIYYTFWCGECEMRFNNVRGACTHLRGSPQHIKMSQNKSTFLEAISSLGTRLVGVTDETLGAHMKKYDATLENERSSVEQVSDITEREKESKTSSPKDTKKNAYLGTPTANASLSMLDDEPESALTEQAMGLSRADPAIQKKPTDFAPHQSAKRPISVSTKSSSKQSKTKSLTQRPPTTWFCDGLPAMRSSFGEPQWNEMEFFTGSFLTEVFNLPENMRGGWVIPVVNISHKRQKVPTNGPIWLAKVATNPELPHRIGAHGLYYQFVQPMQADHIVPLFVAERANHNETIWYCGHYEIEDGESAVPRTFSEKESMRTLSRRVLKQFRKDFVKGRNPANIFPWKRGQISKLTKEEVYDSLIPKFNNAAPLPCYKRRLIFHHFDKFFYDSLVVEKSKWERKSVHLETDHP